MERLCRALAEDASRGAAAWRCLVDGALRRGCARAVRGTVPADTLRRSYALLGAPAVRAAVAAAMAGEGIRDEAEVDRRIAVARQTIAAAMTAVLIRHRYGIWYGDDELSAWAHRAAALFPAEPTPPRYVSPPVAGDDEVALVDWCFEHITRGPAREWNPTTACEAVHAWLRDAPLVVTRASRRKVRSQVREAINRALGPLAQTHWAWCHPGSDWSGAVASLSCLAAAHVRRGDVRTARRIFASAVDAVVSAQGHACVIASIAAEMVGAGWYSAALETAFGAFHVQADIQGVEMLLEPLAQPKGWRFLLEAVSRIPEPNRSLRTRGFCVQAHLARGDIEAARRAYTSFTAAQQQDRTQWLLVDIAEAQARTGDWASALAEVLEIQRTEEQFEGLSRIAFVCSRLGALDALRERVARIAETDQRHRGLTAIALVLAEMGNQNRAMQMIAGVSDSYLWNKVVRAIADNQIRGCEWEAAIATIRTLSDLKEREDFLSGILQPLLQAGHISLAWATAASLSTSQQRDKALTPIVRALVCAGRWEEARAAIEQIEFPNHRLLARLILVEAVLQAGDATAGRDALADVVEASLAIKPGFVQPDVLRAVANVLQRIGWRTEARLANRAASRGNSWADELVLVARLLLRLGKPDRADRAFAEALDVARSSYEERRRAEILAPLAVSFAAVGRQDMARDTLREAMTAAKAARPAWWKYEALASVAVAQARIGDWKPAVELARTFPPGRERLRVEVLVAASAALVRAGDYLGGQQLLCEALDEAREIVDEWECGAAMETVVRLRVRSNPDAAVEIAAQITAPHYSTRALALAGWAFVRQKELERALDVFLTIPDEDRRGDALDRFAQVCQRAGAWDLATRAVRAVPELPHRTPASVLARLAVRLAEVGDGVRGLTVAEEALRMHLARQANPARQRSIW